MHVSVIGSVNTAHVRIKPGHWHGAENEKGESLWVFLDVQYGEAMQNIAERAHQFGVLWRKRSQGTCSEKDNRWVERV
jgi:hypothetical protein